LDFDLTHVKIRTSIRKTRRLKSSELDNLEENAVMLNTRVRGIPALAKIDSLRHKEPKFSHPSVVGDGYDGVNRRLEGSRKLERKAEPAVYQVRWSWIDGS
jgi:hypothetical protein